MKLMKVWFFAACCLAAAFSAGQGDVKMMKRKMVPVASAIYACPKCDAASMVPGKCPDGTKLVKINGTKNWECPKCKMHAMKPGNCPKCKVAMKATVDTFACEMCKVTSKKAGMCPKCGDKMKPYHMEVIPSKMIKKG